MKTTLTIQAAAKEIKIAADMAREDGYPLIAGALDNAAIRIEGSKDAAALSLRAALTGANRLAGCYGALGYVDLAIDAFTKSTGQRVF